MTDKKQTVEEYLKENLIHVYSDEDEAKDVCRITFKALAMARVEEREKCKYDFDKMFVDAAKDAEEKGRCELLNEIIDYFEMEIGAYERANNSANSLRILKEQIKTRFLPKEKEATQ